jgi:hypothetical protein
MSRTHDVTISAFDLDRLERELTAVTEQRDRLERERDEWANKWAELSRSCVKDTVHWEEKLNEWRTLTSWGGTPEIINDFIKGQQSRICAAQEAEEQRDRLAGELKEAQDAIEMMLRDSSCRRIPAYTEEQLAAVEGLSDD